MNAARLAFSVLSPAGQRARLSVLIFHRVLPQPDPIFPGEVDAARFDSMMGWLSAWFNVLPLDEAVQRLRGGSLPARAAAITFDDGYADNHDVALPILLRHGLSATFFVATGYLDGGLMWNDSIIAAIRGCGLPLLDLGAMGLGRHELHDASSRRRAIESIIRQIKYRPAPDRTTLAAQVAESAEVSLPDDLMMQAGQVQALRRAGMQVGAHTVTHPILARTDLASARREVSESRDTLQSLLGERVGLFAYPNGRAGTDYGPEHARMVAQLGFDAALSTDWGAAGPGADLFQLPRFTPWDRSAMPFALRMLRNLRLSPQH